MNPSYHQIVFFALYERFIAYPPDQCHFHRIRSPWLYADRVGVGSLGRTFRRSRNSAGGIRPRRRAVRHAVRPLPRLLRFPNSGGFVYSQQKRKNYLRLKKTPFGAFCFAHVVSRSTILKMHCFSRPDLPLLFLLQTGAKQRQQKRLLIQREPARCRFLPKAPPTVFRSV